MTFDLAAVRAQFPALAMHDGGRRRIYFDNPAGTQVPQSVADSMSRCLLEANANLGGTFETSHRAGAVVADARAAMGPDQVLAGNIDPVQDLRNATPEHVTSQLAVCREACTPRYIVGAGCEVPRDTPEENVRAMLAFAEAHVG